MSEFIAQFVLPVLSTIFSATLLWYAKKREKKRFSHDLARARERQQDTRKMQAIEAGMQAILRDRIIQLYGYCEKKGYVALYEEKNMTLMYDAYHGLGGNGLVTALYDKFIQFPVRSDNHDE